MQTFVYGSRDYISAPFRRFVEKITKSSGALLRSWRYYVCFMCPPENPPLNRFFLILQVIVLVALGSGAARADEIVLPVDSAPIDDPLHGFCGGSYATSVCTDNGVITPFAAADIAGGFGFASDPGALRGDWLVALLVPNTIAGADNQTFNVSNTAGTATGNTANTNISAGLRGLWTSGDLASFLNLQGSNPANKFSAFAVALDTGVTGFYVYVADLGTMTLLNQAGSTAPAPPILTLSGSSIQSGIEITSFLAGNTQTVATSASSVLQAVPESPSLLLFATGLGFLAMTRRRIGSRRTA